MGNSCIYCGVIIPDDRQVCPSCEVAKQILENQGVTQDQADELIKGARQLCAMIESSFNEIVEIMRKALIPVAESLAELCKAAEQQQEVNNRAARRGRKAPKNWETNKRRFYDK